jgi:hypothetical protein
MINNGKSKIEDSNGKLSISIPSKKNWFILIFAFFWLFGWFFGLNSVTTEFNIGQNKDAGIDGFLIFWTIGWTLGGIAVLYLVLWGIFGKENIIIDGGICHIKKSIFNIGLLKKLDTNEIKNIRVDRIETGLISGNRWSFWGLGPGRIKFDYGLKTFSFGLGVDEAEANYIAELLINKLNLKLTIDN